MTLRSALTAGTAAAAMLVLPGMAHAQYPTAKLQGRLQPEFRTSDITTPTLNTVPGNEFLLRRAYVEFSAQLAENVRSKVEVNATRRAVNLEDAWLEVDLGRYVTWRAGQEKKPVERLEIMSSSTYPVVERGAAVAGLKTPNLVSQNNFLTAAGFTAHDVGTSVLLHADSIATPVALRIGVWDGQGKDNAEVNSAKTYGARFTIAPIHDLSLGLSFVSHDDPVSVKVGSTTVVAADSSGRSRAFGVDGEWGNMDRGLHVVADAAFGRQSRVGALTSTIAGLRAGLPAGTAIEPSFRTYHVVGEYKVLVGDNPVLQGFGPLFRWDHTSPDTDNHGISSTLLTPGVNVYFSPKAWLMVNYDVIRPGEGLDLGRGAGESVHSFKSMMRIFF
ncbi:MAG TPA: porin [Longimicrobiaceae bacterium]|nr:porin [Longimicrobiaceae bacterium]